MKGRCATCKWWRPDSAGTSEWLHDLGPISGFCLKVGARSLRVDPEPDSRALAVCEDESIYGELLTAPDFGCVQWEAKEKSL